MFTNRRLHYGKRAKMGYAKLTKKQKRQLTREDMTKESSCFRPKQIGPLTKNQDRAFQAFYSDQNLFLYGLAGTGKTFLGIYLALESICSGLSTYEKLVIVRSIVPGRDIGFLPGTTEEKAKEYEAPYVGICEELFEKQDAYRLLKDKRMVEFLPTSYNRGITLTNSIVFVDEVQNLTSRELNTIITRLGKNCRMILAGDIRQLDLDQRREFTGIVDFIKIIKRMNSFNFIEYGIDDIVRSPFVKEYITVRTKLEDEGKIEQLY